MNWNAMKEIGNISVEEIRGCPVWCFGTDQRGETSLVPVKVLPVSDLTGKVVGCAIRLANGHQVWAFIGNVDLGNPRATEHFITLSVEWNGRWFHLARYHDVDYGERGPDQLARFLALKVDDVFPISYDLTPYVSGESAVLKGLVYKEPLERLSRSELIAMSVL